MSLIIAALRYKQRGAAPEGCGASFAASISMRLFRETLGSQPGVPSLLLESCLQPGLMCMVLMPDTTLAQFVRLGVPIC